MQPFKILFDQIHQMVIATIAMLPQFLISLCILFITFLVAKLARSIVERILRKTKMRPSLVSLLILLSSLVTWVFGIMIAAIIVFPNLTPTKMLAGLGIGSVAIGFAFKDIFENFLSGIIILMRREMRIGDVIECQDLEGQIEKILVRETHIRQADGQLVVVPNSLLFKNPLTIRTDTDERRTTIICGIAYAEDIDVARDVIYGAVTECESVITDDKPVQIFAQEFADSSINFEISWWTGSKPLDIRYSRDEVITAIKRALDNENIEIPFPYRTLTFADPLKIDTQKN